MSSANASTEETEAPPLNILSLDGGGVKGLSSLLILLKIMEGLQIKLDQPNLAPWQVFDLICGSSTGGISALMLGRLRMTVEECIVVYIELAKETFGHKQEMTWSWNWLMNRDPPTDLPAYDHERLERVLKEIISRKEKERFGNDDPEAKMRDPSTDCRVFVLGVRRDRADAAPHRFRTYKDELKDDTKTKIWEAARATSAIIGYFKPFTLENETWVDTAFGYSNPTGEAQQEAKAIWGERPIGCLLSLGTGEGKIISMSGKQTVESVNQTMIKISDSCTKVHRELYTEYRTLEKNPYFRFSVDRGLADMKHDEWEQMEGTDGEMTAITMGYMRGAYQEAEVKRLIAVLSSREIEVPQPKESEAEELTLQEESFL